MMLMLDNAMDHPRACGENSLLDKNSALSIGSPPRMRGKPRFTHKIVGNGRITPAHAGKTNVENSKLCNHRDHPRACGENYLYQQGQPAPEGSPPRMRGKPYIVAFVKPLQRITPAHAGKTLLGAGYGDELKDHPRACGENFSMP